MSGVRWMILLETRNAACSAEQGTTLYNKDLFYTENADSISTESHCSRDSCRSQVKKLFLVNDQNGNSKDSTLLLLQESSQQ